MNRAGWHFAVLIPARDEEQLIARCLRSVQAARRQLPRGTTSDVIVVSDCSVDRTQEIAEALLGSSGIVLRSGAGLVGAARAQAAKTAIERSPGPLHRCWLANTDADCEIPSGWLLKQFGIAQRGAAAVAGTVTVDSFAEHNAQVLDLFRLTYTIHGDGTHPHVHGANLGVRADAYLDAGGWNHLATAEDHDLWSRLKSRGHHRISDAALQVTTSGRRKGRAPFGFADALAAHNETAA